MYIPNKLDQIKKCLANNATKKLKEIINYVLTVEKNVLNVLVNVVII